MEVVEIKKTSYEELSKLWLKLRHAACIEGKEWRLQLDYMPHHILMISMGSKVKIVVDGRITYLQPGHAFVILPGQLIQAAMVTGNEKGLYLFQFDAIEEIDNRESDLAICRKDSVFPVMGEVCLHNAPTMNDLCNALMVLWQSDEALDRMRSQAVFQDLLCHLLEDAQSKVAEVNSHVSVDRTMDYMEKYSHLPLTIDELAEMAGISRYYYMRSFKQLNGRSAMDYLSELRIQQAKLLLENPKMKLREVAKQVGYNDEYYFIRKFKQQVGIPPATYMKNRQRKVAAYSFANIGQLLALKIVPFAAPMDHYWTDMYRRKYQHDVSTPLSHDYTFNREALELARPDFILGIDHFVPVQEQEKLKQVAPAFFVPWHAYDWRDHLRLTAAFLGIEPVAELWLEDYDRKAAKIKELVSETMKGDTVIIVHMSDEHFYVYGERSIGGVLYHDLGFHCPHGIKEITSHKLVTLDQLAEYDADRILLMSTNRRTAQENGELLRKNEAWMGLKAVKNQAVSNISPWLWFEYSAYTQERFLNEVAMLVKA